MKRSDKAERIGRILDGLYPAPAIPLAHRDPFGLLVAVVLSAQTTDKMVNRVAPVLLERAGDAAGLARMPLGELRRLLRPIGLAPTKAKNLKALAGQLLERHGGAVPADFAALEALAGVGHKSASVVMAQAFGVPAFPVDTHIHRLAARWGLSDGSTVGRTERDLKRVFAPASWNRRHLQMIYFGRQHCPARGHDLSRCPICSWAATRKRIRQEAAARRPRRRR
jgi:endonuclease-3